MGWISSPSPERKVTFLGDPLSSVEAIFFFPCPSRWLSWDLYCLASPVPGSPFYTSHGTPPPILPKSVLISSEVPFFLEVIRRFWSPLRDGWPQPGFFNVRRNFGDFLRQRRVPLRSHTPFPRFFGRAVFEGAVSLNSPWPLLVSPLRAISPSLVCRFAPFSPLTETLFPKKKRPFRRLFFSGQAFFPGVKGQATLLTFQKRG